MNSQEEKYIHLAECAVCFNDAWRILKELLEGGQSAVLYDAAFRFALVSYAKPYTRSDGLHKSGRNSYRLEVPQLSAEELALHNEIMTLRNRSLAHADLTMKDAYVLTDRIGGVANISYSQNSPSPLPSPAELINLIERTLKILYAKKAKLLEEIVPMAEQVEASDS